MIIAPDSNLYQIFTSTITSQTGFPHQSSGLFRPTEASATLLQNGKEVTYGKCPRSVWYRLKKVPPSSPPGPPNTVQRMNVGKAVEDDFVNTCINAGIYVDRNVKFKATFNGIPISGEMDVINRTEPCGLTKYVVECKSLYGYNAQKAVFGNAYKLGPNEGAPRDSYLMQLGLYLYKFSSLPEDDPSYLPFGCIYICDRGDGHYGMFDTWISKETIYVNEDEEFDRHKINYKSSHLGVPERCAPYSIDDILKNYSMITEYLKEDSPPPRPFVRQYSREQVEEKFEAGELSKSNYEKWKSAHGSRGKGKFQLGDFQCNPLYCKWSDLCWDTK